MSIFLLGLLPFFWALWLVIGRENLFGAYSYLYKFSPYLTIFYWLRIVSKRGLAPLAKTVKFLAAILSLRQIAVFAFPETLGEKVPKAIYDATVAYGFVGSIPRVFGPGITVMGLAVALYVGDWTRRRLTLTGFVGLALALLASGTTLTRGLVLTEVAAGIIILSIRASRARGLSRLTAASGATLVLLLIVIFVGLGNSGAFENLTLGASDRLSLDTKTLDWRSAQLERAFVTSDQWWSNPVFGVGPQTFIRNDVNSKLLDANELHYSYLSVLWTFGAIGFVLLVLPLGVMTVLGCRMALNGQVAAEWYVGMWMFIVTGLYTVTFTEVGTALGVTLCAAAVLGSLSQRNSVPAVGPGKLPVASMRRTGAAA